MATMSIDDIVGMLSGVQTNRYTNMAATGIYIYDIWLTLDQEASRFRSLFAPVR